ncbi:hypothetical protein TSUD_58220 [Trifolium subterraneum]|uniref:CCHC-type domain-containing protein n=1 Tax=Trifolium subterraneum TaxID=3900 RepID=A0A2Z6MJK6_TRISU|nr:hypothetical protein TSUD_58220 [Trifolium subterraneum]
MLMENLLRSKEHWSAIEDGVTVAPPNATAEQLKIANNKRYDEGDLGLNAKQISRIYQVDDYFARTLAIANRMTAYCERLEQMVIVEKVLRSPLPKFNYVVCSIEQSTDVTTLSVDALQNSLLVQEKRLKSQTDKEEEQALKVASYGRGNGGSRGRGRSSSRVRGRWRVSKENVECYKCYKLGHYQSDCLSWGENDANYAAFDQHEKSWKGNLKLCIGGLTQVITDVYYIPGLKNNLLSIGQLQQKDLTIVFKQDFCKVYHPERVQMDNNELWHCRYGHLNFKGLNTLVKKDMVKGLPQLQDMEDTCVGCLTGKQHREAIPKSSNWRATKPLELVHQTFVDL